MCCWFFVTLEVVLDNYIRDLNLFRGWLVNTALIVGVSWVDMHKLANKEMLSSMKDSGILTGDIEYMMKVW